MSNIEIDVANQQTTHPIAAERLSAAVRSVLTGEGIRRGEISIAITNDETMQVLNRRYLQHDYATDVLSFLLESRPGWLQGEIIISADTAAKTAPEYKWSTEHELLLYAIHGALHLVGFDDTTPQTATVMRQKERHYLTKLAVESPRVDMRTRDTVGDDSDQNGDAGR